MRVTLTRAALLGTVAAAALITTPAIAQENLGTNPATANNQQTENASAEASDQTIVVTARRRNEILLDVPVAVTAYSGEQLNRQGALDITDIADTTPNVTLEVSRGTNSTLTPFIRGIGQQDPVAGFEQGVGLRLGSSVKLVLIFLLIPEAGTPLAPPETTRKATLNGRFAACIKTS